jgi:hypothetical protein
VDDYKLNLVRLFDRLKEVVSSDCLVIWTATLPISKHVRGGFLIPEVEFMNSTLRLDILEANFYAQQVVVSHGFDLLDLHYYFRNQLHRRAGDGVHWDQTAHRRMTNLLLTHISGNDITRVTGLLSSILTHISVIQDIACLVPYRRSRRGL